MRYILLVLSVISGISIGAEFPIVSDSVSPDGKFYVAMDIDRDPSIVIEGKDDSWPKIEITEKPSGRVLKSISYFGDLGSDARPLREHIKIFWRPDSKALGITIHDRFYSMSGVYVQKQDSLFTKVSFPSYTDMTGFPSPDPKDLRPRGRNIIAGWDKEDRLIYDIFMSPEATYKGPDPLNHRILLKVTAEKMIPMK